MGKLFALMILGLVACGGDSGEPLVSGSLTGVYAGRAFTPEFGFITAYNGTNLIGVGDGPIHCGSESDNEPPSGTNALFTIPTVAVGTYSSVSVQLIQNIDSYEGVGSNTGTVTITAVTETTVSGTVSFSYTNSDSETFSLSGSFEVKRCL